MTVTELHIEFKFRMDKLDSLNYPNFLPEEIDLLLNNAQQRIIKQRYGKTNLKREGYEETQKRTEDLKNITVNAIITPSALASDNIDPIARFFTLPSNHWFTIQERSTITCNLCGINVTNLVEVIPINHSEFSKRIKDPFSKPDEEQVLRLMENGKAELLSSCTLVDYRLRYVKEPAVISLLGGVTSELSNQIHSEIVDMAVVIALEGTEAKRTQSFSPLINNTNE